MKRIPFFNLASIRQITLIVLFLAFNSCHRNNSFEDDNRNLMIIRIGETSFTKAEFEDACNTIQNFGVSKDSAIKRTLKACIFNSIILKYLYSIHFELSNEDKNELAFLNRNTLIKLTKDSLLKQIKINPMDVQREIEMFRNKQIVVDYIWLPYKDQKIIDEIFPFLNSGGSIVDMIYSDKRYFERITALNGQIRRLNVEPGQFCHKISKFITLGKKDETKVFQEGKGYYVIKILYSKKDNFQYWSYDEVKRNLKISSFLNYAPLYSNIKISDINLEVLNNADFSVSAITKNNKYAAEFFGKKITLKEIKNLINSLPFNQKVIFNNQTCIPSSVAILILLKVNKHPINSIDLITELPNRSVLNVDKRNNKRYDNFFEYQWLQLFEKSTFYPWLFPFLFQDFDSVSINYDLLYNNQLVDFKDYNLKDTIAVSTNFTYLTVEDFIKEIDATDKVSASKLMNINNAKKLIYYYFENNENLKPQNIKIDGALLENVLLGYIRNLEFENFTSGMFGVTDRNPRRYFPGETQIFNSPELSLNINELRNLINEYPNIIQSNIRTDQTLFNKYWRLNAFIDIIENEIWVKRAKKLNLQNSIVYRLQVKKNTNKIMIKSFLNSNKNEIDSCLFFSKFKYCKPLNIWIDSQYFDGYNKYIDSLKKSYSEIFNK